MQQRKELFGHLLKRSVVVLLSTVFFSLFCVSCESQISSELDAQIKYERFLLADIVQCLDNQSSIYSYLSNVFAEASEEPDNTELQTKLIGALEGIHAAKQWNSGKELSLYQEYSTDNQELYSVMQDVIQSVPSPDEKFVEIFNLSAEQLAEISQLYSQLSNCFFRGNSTTLASIIVDKKFEEQAFQSALQTTDYLLSELDDLIHFRG